MPPRLGPLDPEVIVLFGLAGAALGALSYILYNTAQQIGGSVSILPPLPPLPRLPGLARR